MKYKKIIEKFIDAHRSWLVQDIWHEDMWDLEAWVNVYMWLEDNDPLKPEFRQVIWEEIRSITWKRGKWERSSKNSIEPYFNWDKQFWYDQATSQNVTLVEKYRRIIEREFSNYFKNKLN